MSDQHTVQRCRWAEPTLFQKPPVWTAADEYPWSCRADGEVRPVTDTLVCLTCGRWASRGEVECGGAADGRCDCTFDGC